MSAILLGSLLAVVVIAVLPLILIPEYRANYLIWRGKEREARPILEALVQQYPEKLHLYPKLARIYYIENRRDRRAIKVYELMIRFRVPFDWREELYTIIAKQYIVDGRKDTAAIRLIEKAVDKEIRRLETNVA